MGTSGWAECTRLRPGLAASRDYAGMSAAVEECPDGQSASCLPALGGQQDRRGGSHLPEEPGARDAEGIQIVAEERLVQLLGLQRSGVQNRSPGSARAKLRAAHSENRDRTEIQQQRLGRQINLLGRHVAFG